MIFNECLIFNKKQHMKEKKLKPLADNQEISLYININHKTTRNNNNKTEEKKGNQNNNCNHYYYIFIKIKNIYICT